MKKATISLADVKLKEGKPKNSLKWGLYQKDGDTLILVKKDTTFFYFILLLFLNLAY